MPTRVKVDVVITYATCLPVVIASMAGQASVVKQVSKGCQLVFSLIDRNTRIRVHCTKLLKNENVCEGWNMQL